MVTILCLQRKDYGESLQWYNYSLSLFSNKDVLDVNLAKLYRNKASCLMGMNEIDKVSGNYKLQKKVYRLSYNK